MSSLQRAPTRNPLNDNYAVYSPTIAQLTQYNHGEEEAEYSGLDIKASGGEGKWVGKIFFDFHIFSL